MKGPDTTPSESQKEGQRKGAREGPDEAIELEAWDECSKAARESEGALEEGD